MFVASSYCKWGEVIVHAYQESDMVVCAVHFMVMYRSHLSHFYNDVG